MGKWSRNAVIDLGGIKGLWDSFEHTLSDHHDIVEQQVLEVILFLHKNVFLMISYLKKKCLWVCGTDISPEVLLVFNLTIFL